MKLILASEAFGEVAVRNSRERDLVTILPDFGVGIDIPQLTRLAPIETGTNPVSAQQFDLRPGRIRSRITGAQFDDLIEVFDGTVKILELDIVFCSFVDESHLFSIQFDGGVQVLNRTQIVTQSTFGTGPHVIITSIFVLAGNRDVKILHRTEIIFQVESGPPSVIISLWIGRIEVQREAKILNRTRMIPQKLFGAGAIEIGGIIHGIEFDDHIKILHCTEVILKVNLLQAPFQQRFFCLRGQALAAPQ